MQVIGMRHGRTLGRNAVVFRRPCWLEAAFWLGEAYDHRECSVRRQIAPTFHAFIRRGVTETHRLRPLTIAEFKGGKGRAAMNPRHNPAAHLLGGQFYSLGVAL